MIARRQILRQLCLASLAPVVIANARSADTTAGPAMQSSHDGSDEMSRHSEANLSVLQRYVAAIRAHDRAAIIASYHKDITLHWFGHRLAGNYIGKAQSLKALAAFARRTHRKFVGFVEVMAGPERGAMITREAFERGGESAEFERVYIFAFKDQLLHEGWVYDTDPARIDRFLT